MWNLVNTIKEESTNRLIDTENRLMVARGERDWRTWGEGKVMENDSNGDLKYSIANIVSSTIIAIYGARWVLEIPGEQFVKYLINHYAIHLKLKINIEGPKRKK